MKLLFAIVVSLVSLSCAAEGWYVGGGAGSSKLNYDVRGLVSDKITDHVTAPSAGFLNVPYSLEEQFTGNASKFFVGYTHNKWVQTELTYKKYGSYTANVSLNNQINRTVVGGDGIDQHTATVNGSTSGSATATASAKSVGLSWVITPIHGDTADVFFRIGAEYGQAKWKVDGDYKYQYNYSVVPANPLTPSTIGSGSGSGSLSTSEHTEKGYIAVVGIGFAFKLTKQFSLRLEAERAGDPRKSDNTLDMYTASLIYRF